MPIHYLKFNQHARLYGWLQQNRKNCIQVTGIDPIACIAKPLAPMDLKTLPYTHADFPKDVQWWVNKYCPYPYAKEPVKGCWIVIADDFLIRVWNKIRSIGQKEKPIRLKR